MIKTYIELFKAVKEHMNWNDEKTSFWFNTDNPLLGNCSPRWYYWRRPEKCTSFILNLIEENTKPDNLENA